MKYLFVFLLVGFYSCGNSEAIDVIGQEERKKQEKLEKQKKLEEEFKKNPKDHLLVGTRLEEHYKTLNTKI